MANLTRIFVTPYTENKKKIYNACVKHSQKLGKTLREGDVYIGSNTVYTGFNEAYKELSTLQNKNCACTVLVFGDVCDDSGYIETPEYKQALNAYNVALADFKAEYDVVHYAVQNTSLKNITCRSCGAKFPTFAIHSNVCSSCGADLRPKSLKEKLEQKHAHVEKLKAVADREYKNCAKLRKREFLTTDTRRLLLCLNYVD